MGALHAIVEDAFHVEQHGLDRRSAAAGALAVGAPLLVGLAAGEPHAGVLAALGGLNGALAVPRGPLARRAGWAALVVGGCLLAVALAGAAGGDDLPFALVTLAWVAAWALLRTCGPVGALAGFAVGAVLVVVGGLPQDGVALGTRVGWFALGAVPAAALMVLARGRPDRVVPDVRAAVAAAARSAAGGGDRAVALHATRLASAVALTTIFVRALELPHGYWVPLTVLAVLQPGRRATRVRAVQRALGTLGGAAVIVAVTVATGEPWALAALAGVAASALFALDERGYLWLVVLLTPVALLVLSVARYEGDEIALERVAESALGIAIGLAVGEAVGWLSRDAPVPPADPPTDRAARPPRQERDARPRTAAAPPGAPASRPPRG